MQQALARSSQRFDAQDKKFKKENSLLTGMCMYVYVYVYVYVCMCIWLCSIYIHTSSDIICMCMYVYVYVFVYVYVYVYVYDRGLQANNATVQGSTEKVQTFSES